MPWGAATRKKEAEAHRRLQAHFCLRSLGGPRFRSLLRLAAGRKFRVVGKRSLWQAIHFDVAACPTDVAACPTDVAACPTRETAGR